MVVGELNISSSNSYSCLFFMQDVQRQKWIKKQPDWLLFWSMGNIIMLLMRSRLTKLVHHERITLEAVKLDPVHEKGFNQIALSHYTS